MRRWILVALILGVFVFGGGGSAIARQDAPAPVHPIVGTWLADTDTEDPENTPETFIFTGDGGYFGSDPEGATLGVWEATGPSTANLTFSAIESDEENGFYGTFIVRAAFEVSADGQSFTAEYTMEFVSSDGVSTGEAGPGTAVGTRVAAEAPGTPVLTQDEFWGAMFESFNGMSEGDDHESMDMNQDVIVFDLMDPAGAVIGKAGVTGSGDGGTVVTVLVAGLTPGEHGIHVHEAGICDGSTEKPFSSAGGHFNPTAAMHGEHAGDLGNLTADGEGDALLIGDWTVFTLDTGDLSLLDADGSALVIHETVDDLVTDPSGNSGGRIACGVIAPPQ